MSKYPYRQDKEELKALLQQFDNLKTGKNKAKVTLNITTPNTLRNSISLNLKSGLKYTGSLLVSQQVDGKSLLSNTLLTYQKGNTVYIIPHKQIIAVPEMKQGYTGMKLIIKSH